MLIAAFLLVRDSPLVRVERVSVVGASGPEAPRIRAALAEAARGMTTLHVRVGALREAVKSYPTVKDVRVDRDLPHGLKVIVVGRPAVAALTAGDERVAVAADGTLLRGATVPGDVPKRSPFAASATPAVATDARPTTPARTCATRFFIVFISNLLPSMRPPHRSAPTVERRGQVLARVR